MGQVQSEAAAAAAAAVDNEGEQLSPAVTPQSDSHAATATSSINLDSLIAEAAAYGNDKNEVDGQEIFKLEAWEVSDHRVFYHQSMVFGSDCVHPFVALQKCIKAYPNAFSKDILEEDEVKKEEKPTEQYKIRPPLWAKMSKT